MNLKETLPLENIDAVILTEGKTDWQHLKKAYEKLGLNLAIKFYEYTHNMGDTELLDMCKKSARLPNTKTIIFLFDHDDDNIVKKVSGEETIYKDWGNRVFSFAIPVPDHRKDYQNVSIEFYYVDAELKTKDLEGRRLFLTSEFHRKSFKYKDDPTIHIVHRAKLKDATEEKYAKILDSGAEILDSEGNNIALSKAKFVENICNDIPPFDDFNFESFREIFKVVNTILQSIPQVAAIEEAERQELRQNHASAKLQTIQVDNLSIQFSQLSLEEQIIVRIISKVGKLIMPVVELIGKVLKAPPNAYTRIAETDFSVVHHPELPILSEISIIDEAPSQTRELTLSDIRYFTMNLKEFLDRVNIKSYYIRQALEVMLSELKKFAIADQLVYSLLNQFEYKIKGFVYCENCDAYFPRYLRFCPNCGGYVDYQKNTVIYDKKIHNIQLIPFPSIDLLRKGTFDISRGVSAKQVHALQTEFLNNIIE